MNNPHNNKLYFIKIPEDQLEKRSGLKRAFVNPNYAIFRLLGTYVLYLVALNRHLHYEKSFDVVFLFLLEFQNEIFPVQNLEIELNPSFLFWPRYIIK